MFLLFKSVRYLPSLSMENVVLYCTKHLLFFSRKKRGFCQNVKKGETIQFIAWPKSLLEQESFKLRTYFPKQVPTSIIL